MSSADPVSEDTTNPTSSTEPVIEIEEQDPESSSAEVMAPNSPVNEGTGGESNKDEDTDPDGVHGLSPRKADSTNGLVPEKEHGSGDEITHLEAQEESAEQPSAGNEAPNNGKDGKLASSTVRASDPFDPDDYQYKVKQISRCIGVFGFGTAREKPDEVYKALTEFGPVEEVDFIKDPRSGKYRGYGFVYFRNLEDAKRVVEGSNRKGLIVGGLRLRMDYSRSATTMAKLKELDQRRKHSSYKQNDHEDDKRDRGSRRRRNAKRGRSGDRHDDKRGREDVGGRPPSLFSAVQPLVTPLVQPLLPQPHYSPPAASYYPHQPPPQHQPSQYSPYGAPATVQPQQHSYAPPPQQQYQQQATYYSPSQSTQPSMPYAYPQPQGPQSQPPPRYAASGLPPLSNAYPQQQPSSYPQQQQSSYPQQQQSNYPQQQQTSSYGLAPLSSYAYDPSRPAAPASSQLPPAYVPGVTPSSASTSSYLPHLPPQPQQQQQQQQHYPSAQHQQGGYSYGAPPMPRYDTRNPAPPQHAMGNQQSYPQQQHQPQQGSYPPPPQQQQYAPSSAPPYGYPTQFPRPPM